MEFWEEAQDFYFDDHVVISWDQKTDPDGTASLGIPKFS